MLNFFSENLVHEIIWDSMQDPDRPQMTKQRCAEKMRLVCWIPKATNTYRVITQDAFP
jgi:hypothetical protein